ncbi:MAG: NrdH-redoxin [Candidatus Aenigmarchaeota archaeon ex4484_52]|nr:MAG: NrdH-redoxin [Candidatus Aenigmarchaeota archaeon ex4484_52]
MVKKIIVYSTNTCPYCDYVKDYLKEKNLEFENIDVSSDRQKAQEMMDKSGQMGVPVIDIDGKIIIGFDKEKINDALK